MEQQVQESAQQKAKSTTEPQLEFRDYVSLAIVFGCVPALVLSVILWAVATTFPHAGILPSILGLLVTLLLTLMGIILLVRYVDITYLCYHKSMSVNDDGSMMFLTIGAGAVCIFLTVCAVGCLSVAGVLEGWHYTLITGEVALVGYQVWRIFTRR